MPGTLQLRFVEFDCDTASQTFISLALVDMDRVAVAGLSVLHLLFEQIQKQQLADTAAFAARSARGQDVGRDANAFFADDLKCLDHRDVSTA